MAKAISKRTRFEVFKRDGFTCQYCGRTPPSVMLEVDHIHPRSLGGGNDMTNLVSACEDCNRGKAARTLGDAPPPLREAAKRAAEAEAQLRAYDMVLREIRERKDMDVYAVLEVFDRYFVPEAFLANGAPASVRRFLERLPAIEVMDAAELACSRMGQKYRAFRYFCGICWSKIRAAEGGGSNA